MYWGFLEILVLGGGFFKIKLGFDFVEGGGVSIVEDLLEWINKCLNK